MASEWPLVTVGELADSISDTHKLGKDQLVFLNTSDVLLGKILHRTYSAVRDWPGQAKKSIRRDDVLFSEIRPANGRWACVEVDADDYVVSTKLMVIRSRKNLVVPRFLYHFLTSSETTRSLQHLAESRSGTFPQITFDQVAALELALPPLAAQAAIATFLDCITNKIELNRRMNETLEAMARALFKSWFVDFDPVRAKAADLIRDGVLEIGDGYRAKNSEIGEPGLPFIRAGNLSNGIDTRGAEVLRQDSVAKAGRKRSRPGDVAFTSKGTVGRFARVTDFTQPFVYSPQVCFWRSLDWERLQPAILYCWMQSEDLKSQINAVAGQTDMAPYVSLRDQRTMEVPVFAESQNTIARHLDALLVRQALAAAENTTLAALRDALLPKLISGELRVDDAERVVAHIAS